MKVSLNWANWHSKMDLAPKGVEILSKKIGSQLGEIEEVVRYGSRYGNMLIVKVVVCEKHPNADKLSICLVDDNGVAKNVKRDKKGLVQVVCGAPNVHEGMLAAWIPPGEVVPSTVKKDPFKLETREIRGELSNGMLASPSELDLYDEHEGILEIEDNKAKIGVALNSLYGLDDVIIDIENKMFTHRPDCFGVLGVARELAGIQGEQFTSPQWYSETPVFKEAAGLELRVKNEVPDLVPRFMAVALSGVEVKPSPVWLKAGLKRVGIKPINNVVDITNYLMYVTGQPLHAYDYDKVVEKSSEGATLVVRQPKKNEKVKLLGGKTIEPRKEAIMIASDSELLGVGGVMGGADTEVSEDTQNIILECANFDLYSIRKTSMEHGLFTDAVTRFSKGQSPLQNDKVIAKAMELVIQEAGAKQASGVIDENSVDEEVMSRCTIYNPITISSDFINNRLGVDLTVEQIAQLLKNVEFVAEITRGSNLIIKAPFWRTDIEIPEDIVEEIGRLYGYDHLPQKLPRRTSAPAELEVVLGFKSVVRGILSGLGANETLNYSFVHGKVLEKALQSPDNSYKINNALSPDLQYYRQSLTPSLLTHTYPNIRAGYDEFALFEINKSHSKVGGLNKEKVPSESEKVALVYASKKQKAPAYYNARTYLDGIGKKLGLKFEYNLLEKAYDPTHNPYETSRSAIVEAGGKVVGIIGEFKQEVREGFKLPAASAGFEIDLKLLERAAQSAPSSYEPLSKYPGISQDVCLQVTPQKKYQELLYSLTEALNDFKPEDINIKIAPLDIYSPKDGKSKNITFTVSMFSYDRTLKEELANELIAKTVQTLEKKTGAKRV